ncbi:hypothetical protein [Streptomyces sp. UNOC14_S4]|uniref:hypothetical protein n=1 Tax=Streptomyces sp. UNOC14_S4 TaxID=2872340 RepID=UPI001E30DAE9|nr:hypothetical protein [Streptomyces sp. UNOC14_S4]MCC3766383.1 hypothetical protein [Streptomyces sp. UNOC14_S4]
MSHRFLAPFARTALALLLLAGCSGCSGTTGPAALTSPEPACRAPGAAILPQTSGTATEDDNGARICVARGQTIAVFLNAHSNDARAFWKPITAQPSSAIRRESNGTVTLAIGVTAALLTTTAVGDVRLASRKESGGTWTATLVVH